MPNNFEVRVFQYDSSIDGVTGNTVLGLQAVTAINIGTAAGEFNGQALIAGQSISYPNIPSKTYPELPWDASVAGCRIQITGFK